MSVMIGMMGFVIDIGHVMYVQRQLQGSADAAALAGARQINCCTTSTAASIATSYSAVWTNGTTAGGNKNVDPRLYVQMASGYPKLKCLTSIGISCTGPDAANAIVIKQTATVPMWFAGIFGLTSIPVTATATAGGTGGGAGNYDIDIVLDTTASMNTNDASCGKTRIQCALAGLQLLLNKMSPTADYVGVMAFPPLSNASQQSHDTTCPTSNPAITAYKNVGGAATGTYQVVGLSHDYQTSTQGQLNTSSSLAIAAGGSGVSGCQGVEAVGGYGTYYADALTAAQTDIANNGRSGVGKAIIILSDGDASASSSNMPTGTANNQCSEAVTAAHNATTAGTKVFTIAYGAATSGSCSTDTGTHATSACATMKNMASSPTMFYSDNANGCQSTTQSITNLIQIFGSIANTFTAPRLLPDNTT